MICIQRFDCVNTNQDIDQLRTPYYFQIFCLNCLDISGTDIQVIPGWIGVLAEWINHEDVRVSIPAAKALANLDVDNHNEYSRCLYLLSPLMRSNKDYDVDVVFVHGLLGGVFYTWRQRKRDPQAVGILGKKNGKGRNLLEVYKRTQQISSDLLKYFILFLSDPHCTYLPGEVGTFHFDTIGISNTARLTNSVKQEKTCVFR